MAFIQFQSMNGVRKFREAMSMSIALRFWYIVTCRRSKIEHKYLNAKIWPELHKAPEPSQIIWSNLGCGPFNRFVRVTIVNLISVAVLASGFYGVAHGKNQLVSEELKSSNLEDFNPFECDQQGAITQEQAIADFNGNDTLKFKVGCFCYQLISSVDSLDDLDKLKFEGLEQNICLIWLKNYLFEKFSVYGIAATISVINVV